MVEDFSKEKRQKFVNIADSMFDSGSNYEEIITLLLKNGLTHYQATEIVKPIFIDKLQSIIKRQKTISIILFIVVIVLTCLYFYGMQTNEAIALENIRKNNFIPNKNGNYTVIVHNFHNYNFLMKASVICTLGLIFTLIRMFLNFRTLKIYN